jgi:AICAR transformylase/IMP cyclohydrolase PurH
MPVDREARIAELERELELIQSEDADVADAATQKRVQAMLDRLRQLHQRVKQGQLSSDDDRMLLEALVRLEIRARETT